VVAVIATLVLIAASGSRTGGPQAGGPAAVASSVPSTAAGGGAATSTADVAFVGTGGGVWALERDGTTSAWAGPDSLSDWCVTRCVAVALRWSPDGRSLAVLTAPAPYAEKGGGDVTVQLMSPGGADHRRVFTCPDAQCERGWGRSLAWSPDSREVAVTVGDDLYVADIGGGAPDLVCTCKASPVTYLRDGRLAIIEEDGLAAIDPATRQTTLLATVPDAVSAVWAPDRAVALVTLKHGGSVVVNVVAHARLPVQRLHATAAAWSPDSFPCAFTVQARRRTEVDGAELWISGPTGRGPELVHRFPAEAGAVWGAAPVWSPDGGRIALFFRPVSNPGNTPGTVRIIDVRSRSVVAAFTAEGQVAWRDA